MAMYGFKITVTPGAGDDPGSLSASLDKITEQLAEICSATAAFKGYMVTEHTDSVTFLITAEPADEVKALTAAISWLHTAVYAAGFPTPGWLKCAEQVFDSGEQVFDSASAA